MTPDEAIRVAAIIASLVSVVVTVTLFLARELIDRRRRRVKSGTTLLLYSTIVVRTLQRNSMGALPFSMKEVLEAASDIVRFPASSALLAHLEESMFALNSAANSKTPMLREERERMISQLTSAASMHACRLRIPAPKSTAQLPAPR